MINQLINIIESCGCSLQDFCYLCVIGFILLKILTPVFKKLFVEDKLQ